MLVDAPETAECIPVNLDSLAGFDVTTYRTRLSTSTAYEVRVTGGGLPEPVYRWSFVTSRYRSFAEHLAAFRADPAKYAPSFGGYCAYGVSRGYAVSIDPEAFTIMNNRLLLQNSKSVLRRWQEDPGAHLVKADSNWPGIVEKQGKPRQ